MNFDNFSREDVVRNGSHPLLVGYMDQQKNTCVQDTSFEFETISFIDILRRRCGEDKVGGWSTDIRKSTLESLDVCDAPSFVQDMQSCNRRNRLLHPNRRLDVISFQNCHHTLSGDWMDEERSTRDEDENTSRCSTKLTRILHAFFVLTDVRISDHLGVEVSFLVQ